MSDGSFLYLFLEFDQNNIINKQNKHDVITIELLDRKYAGVITNQHSPDNVSSIINDMTSLRGFECVAGMKQLKSVLIRDVINPLRNPDKYNKFKLTIPNEILLYGPPGCGKTFIVQKLAEELGYSLFEMIPSSIATSYVHGAVGNIGHVFELAKKQAPAIVFIDDIEGLVPKREELSSFSDTKKEEINEFLIQLNNAGRQKILVIGATNRPQMIDTAILRSGRMDKRIYVPPPDFEARVEMFKIMLTGCPHDPNIDFTRLAKMTDDYAASDIELIVNNAARTTIESDKDSIGMLELQFSIDEITSSISPGEISFFEQFFHLERT